MSSWCIIFLDIDGVLNKVDGLRDRDLVSRFDRNSVYNLNILIDGIINRGLKPGIVLSSSWRIKKVAPGQFTNYSLQYLRKLFSEYNFSRYIIDTTPIFSYLRDNASLRRQLEISSWTLNELKIRNISKVIILDDISMKELEHQHVKCSLFGEKELERALSLL